MTGSDVGLPGPRYIPAHHVLAEMASFGHTRLTDLTSARVLVLAMLAGGFITAGALLSVILGAGIQPSGIRLLVEGLAFGTGFFFVVLSQAVLFTEANVVIPATLLDRAEPVVPVLRFWALAFAGNFLGALTIGALVSAAQTYPPEVLTLLAETVDRKMEYRGAGGSVRWLAALLSGVLANWLVGMAAFFATMGRTIVGKYIPVALAVTIFVAANFQHSPANMGYFSLLMLQADGPGWAAAFGWNLVPAGIGNLIGGTLLVALPFSFAFGARAGASL